MHISPRQILFAPKFFWLSNKFSNSLDTADKGGKRGRCAGRTALPVPWRLFRSGEGTRACKTRDSAGSQGHTRLGAGTRPPLGWGPLPASLQATLAPPEGPCPGQARTHQTGGPRARASRRAAECRRRGVRRDQTEGWDCCSRPAPGDGNTPARPAPPRRPRPATPQSPVPSPPPASVRLRGTGPGSRVGPDCGCGGTQMGRCFPQAGRARGAVLRGRRRVASAGCWDRAVRGCPFAGTDLLRLGHL